MSSPRLTATVCEVCGENAWLGRQGNVVCTMACTSVRARQARSRASMRDLLTDVRRLDPTACFGTGALGVYIRLTIGGVCLRVEDREDLDWIAMDLDRAAA